MAPSIASSLSRADWSKILHAIAHAVSVGKLVEQFQELNQYTDSVFLLRAPNDTRMRCPCLVQREVIGIERRQHAMFGPGELQLLRVGLPVASGLLDRQHI